MDEIINEPLRPTILVVEEDDGARSILVKNLRQLGYRLLVAANVADALEWISGSVYIHADLLLIDLIGKSAEEALVIGRRLRVRGQFHLHTPLVVMPERVGKDMEGADENVGGNDWICHYADSHQLQRLLAHLLESKTKPDLPMVRP